MKRLDVRKGDMFIQHGGGARWPLFVKVTRVARDGTWCDIRCFTWAVTWAKRMPEGISGPMLDPESPMYLRRQDWTFDDVFASEPETLF